MTQAASRVLSIVSLLVLCAPAYAAPRLVPVQGVLTDSAGVPIDGSVEATFRLYDSSAGGSVVWSETQTVEVDSGLFTAYLGLETQLDLSLFKTHGELWLSIQVGADPEGQRMYLGSTPWAGFAQHSSYTAGSGIGITADNVVSSTLGPSVEGSEITDGTVTTADIADGTIRRQDLAQDGCSTDQVMKWDGSSWVCGSGIPAGAVMFFNLSACPSGWSELAAARGRTLVALPAAGTLGGIVGTALSDQGTRSTTQVPAHTHAVDPPVTTSSSSGAHNHSIDPPSTGTGEDSHSHTETRLGTGSYGYISGGCCAGSRESVPTSSYSHSHTVDIAAFDSTTAQDHTHSTDIAQFTTGSSGAASVDVTMPYMQLLACQKD